MAASFLNTAEFVAVRRRIFVAWMFREGHSEVCANEEFDRLAAVNGDMGAYLRTQRTGSKFPLDRRTKEGIAMLYDNAGNHAAYEFEAT